MGEQKNSIIINEYGSEREIGLAPSCKTAGELMFSYQKPLTFTVEETDETVSSYNRSTRSYILSCARQG